MFGEKRLAYLDAIADLVDFCKTHRSPDSAPKFHGHLLEKGVKTVANK